jgi:hypothetical protein
MRKVFPVRSAPTRPGLIARSPPGALDRAAHSPALSDYLLTLHPEKDMLTDGSPCACSTALSRTLMQRVVEDTSGRLRGLRVDEEVVRLVVRGIAPSYYVKQLAIRAVLPLISSTAPSLWSSPSTSSHQREVPPPDWKRTRPGPAPVDQRQSARPCIGPHHVRSRNVQGWRVPSPGAARAEEVKHWHSSCKNGETCNRARGTFRSDPKRRRLTYSVVVAIATKLPQLNVR